ncbi:MAG TPA: hypothetical protein VFY25_03425 [Anaerolineales bacterium]|nr:hypothetical protein [Anaerolineales bacterium]
MILTLLITIIVEGVVVTGYSTWRRKPIYPILLTSVCANLITQSFLWIVLIVFFRYYLMTLIIAEILIWMAESVFLYSVSANHLRFAEAAALSLGMNLMSFALGLFLPI